MDKEKRAQHTAAVLAVLAIGGSMAFGVIERLSDPLSTSGVVAEDPYTHMMLVRGHLLDGELDAVFPGGTLYPPGMHAIIAAAWVYTGLDLYDIFRVGPAVFGAIGILGVAIFVTRHAGPLAGSVAALATALAPEMIFRTTMMAPTAVDLAVIPFLFAAIADTLRGRRAWLLIVALIVTFLVMSHPWMMAILGPVLLGWVVVSMLATNWSGAVRVVPVAAALVLTVIGAGLVAAVTICWDQCGLGFQDLVVGSLDAALDRVSLAIGLACIAAGALILMLRRPLDRLQDHLHAHTMPIPVRVFFSSTIVIVLLVLTLLAIRAGMPEYVDLPRMYGWGVVALAGVAVVCLPFVPGRAALPMAGLALFLYPFVIYNPLDSQFWPHRTAVYLGIALVAMAGIGAAGVVHVVRATADGLTRWAARRNAQGAPNATVAHSRVWSLGAMATIVTGSLMAGTVYAATPLEYEEGWYRLYPDCEFNALRNIAEEAEPGTVIVAGSWEAKLVMGAFAVDGMDVWYSYEIFTRGDRRAGTVEGLEVEGRDMIMVTDRYLRTEHNRFDDSFLSMEPFEPMGSWCSDGLQSARLSASIARAVD